jgi:serine protease AprX
MKCGMRQWMLAVITSVALIASMGMGVAAVATLDDGNTDFVSVYEQKLIENGIEISEIYDVSEITLISGNKFTLVKADVNGATKLFTINPNGKIRVGLQDLIDEKKKAYSQSSNAEIKLDKKMQKIAKKETILEEGEIPVFISVIDKEFLQDLRDYLMSNELIPKAELQNYLPGIAVDINIAVLNELVELDYVSAVYFDSPVEMFLDISVPSIRVNGDNFPSWTDNTLGSGVTVAIVDRGVDDSHPSLIENFESGSKQRFPDTGYNYESHHGTIVAGIVASRNPTIKGVAPNVSLLDAMVTDDSNSWVYAAQAIEWAVNKGANVVQMSIGPRTVDNERLEGLSDFVDGIIYQNDVVFTVAIGQNQSAQIDQNNWEPVVSPAEAFNVISVGAIDDKNTINLNDDTIYYHGFYGTIDGRQKPDIVAPGFRITSLNSTWESGDLFSRWNVGTSFAAPHVAGVAAILLSNDPSLSAKQVKAILLNTANKNPSWFTDDDWERVGFGLVNANEANRNIHNSFVESIKDTTGEKLYYELTPETEHIVTTMVWERNATQYFYGDWTGDYPAGLTMELIDLDMYMFKNGNRVASSGNFRDNVEQIIYQADPADYVLVIKPSSLLSDTDREVPFALAYNGNAVRKDPPILQSSLIAPNTVGSEFTFMGLAHKLIF